MTGVCPQTDLWKKLQSKDDVSLTYFYSLIEKYLCIENSVVALHRHDLGSSSNVPEEAIEDLIKQGHFKEYIDDSAPVREKNREEQGKKRRDRKGICSVGLIFGGPHLGGNSQGAQERYVHTAHQNAIRVMNTVQQPPKVHKEEEITFSEKDAVQLHHPNDDALVITPQIGCFNVHRMLVDNGSIVNILFQLAFEKMKLDEADLKPTSIPLYDFRRDHLIPKGTISLPVMLGDSDGVTKITEFLVIDCLSAFNGILGRPLLRNFRAVTSIYHLKMKFPTPTEIEEVSRS
ncbi:uncharacterized protein LOC116124228 [Pistacia vera]|uniref:uncharacterized protein LOC116124228 n=1 Tax=Pistacia vera TaxID=55513 RepID=UPI0012631087|nr:uncharacterized protein LOC116124228 [Pistacia vera]